LCSGTFVSPSAATTDDTIKSAAAKYFQGRVLDAVGDLDSATAATPDESQKLRLLDLEMDICSAAYYYTCLIQRGPEFVRIVTSLKPGDKLGEAMRANAKAIYIELLERFLARDLSWIEKTFGFDFAVKVADPIRFPDIAINLYILSARIDQYRGQFQKSMESISRAFATLLMLKPGSNYIAARTLADLIQLLDMNKNPVKALQWAVISRTLVTTLPPKSPDKAFLLLSALNLFYYVPLQTDVLKNDFFRTVAEARDVVSGLQIDAAQKEYLLASVASYEFGADIVLGRLDAARAALNANPTMSRREAIIERGKFVTFQELLFALSEVFLDTSSGREADQGWAPAFAAPPGPTLSEVDRAAWDAYAQFGHALLLAKTKPGLAREELESAGRLRLKAFEIGSTRVGDSFPLPSFVDQILIGLAAAPAKDGEVDKDLLLRGMEFLNRNLKYAEADALAVIADQRDADGRDLIHSLLRLSEQQAQWEATQLADLVSYLGPPNPAGTDVRPTTERNAGLRAKTMADFVHLRRQIAEAIAKRESAGSSESALFPSMADLQSVLDPDEAFVGYVTGPIITRVCIRKDGVWTSRMVVDAAKLTTGLKLISSALVAQNPPSNTLDVQYPAERAVEIYHELFDGLSACLRPGDHMIFLPPREIAPIPISALLTEIPTRVGDGYDLQHARWLALQHPISYVVSVRALIAARKISTRDTGDLLFLGVGDPRLNTQLADGSRGGQELAHRSASVPGGALHDLGELPETASELRAIANLLGKSQSELLLGEEATEEQFLSRPLGRYSVIHFATHGLIRGDVPGLSEMALVLTPVDQTDAFNDGLLTAPKIADLNLKARLVVLSACNSAGFDPTVFGSQIPGLTTAFAVAGVPTTIAALWPVESRTSERIMTAFYRHLASKEFPSVARALQSALGDSIENAPSTAFAHPRFWAPFMVYGDGATTLIRTATTTPLANETTEIDPGGGEIIDAANVGNDFITSEIGPYKVIAPHNNGRSSSLVRRRTLDGKILWTLEDRAIGAGPIAHAGNTFYVGGYLWKGRSIPILRAVNDAGKLLWQKEPTTPYQSASWLGFGGTADGGLVAAIGPFNPLAEPAGITLIHFDTRGNEVARSQLPPANLPNGYAIWGSAALAVEGRRLLFAINSGRRIGGAAGQRDDFGLPEVCSDPGGTYLFEIDLDTLSVKKQTFIQGGDFLSLHADGQQTIVAGAIYLVCQLGERAFLGSLDSELKIKLLWRDDGPFESMLRSAIPTPSGYRAAGTIQRALAIQEIAPLNVKDRVPVLQKITFQKHHDYDRFKSDEGIVIDYSREGVVQGKTILDTGLPLFVMGIAVGQQSEVIFGSNGFNSWWGLLH
jgi:CHAT domain-containing protein